MQILLYYHHSPIPNPRAKDTPYAHAPRQAAAAWRGRGMSLAHGLRAWVKGNVMGMACGMGCCVVPQGSFVVSLGCFVFCRMPRVFCVLSYP